MTDEAAEADRPTSGRKRFWLRLLFRLFASVGVLILLLLIAFAFVGFLVYQHVTEPGFPGEVIRVTIPQGVTGREVGRLLTEQGLLEHEGFLRIAMHFDDTGKPIKHGLYALPRGLSPRELLHMLQEGPNRAPEAAEVPPEGKVTIPEGRTLQQMAQTFVEPATFLNAASDPALLERLGIDAPNLEGFLMPDTYYFDDEPSPSALVARMVGEFEAVYADLLDEFPEAGGRDKMEVVTIASLIEKEARVDEERPLIAAVIANRVRRGMPLELDATVQYALGKFGERGALRGQGSRFPLQHLQVRRTPARPHRQSRPCLSTRGHEPGRSRLSVLRLECRW